MHYWSPARATSPATGGRALCRVGIAARARVSTDDWFLGCSVSDEFFVLGVFQFAIMLVLKLTGPGIEGRCVGV